MKVTVQANTAVSTRNGAATIGGKPFKVIQSGTPCTIDINPASADLTSIPQPGTFSVTAPKGCPWAARVISGAPWFGILSGTPGDGNGSVVYHVDKNTTKRVKAGSIKVYLTRTPSSFKTFKVTQQP